MFRIRDARMEDLETIVRFNAAMAYETEGIELDRERLRRGVKAILKDPLKGRYFAAVTDQEMIGQTYITQEWSDWRDAYWWWFQSVYLLPEWRRKGVFRRFHEHIADLVKQTDQVIGLRLYVEQENAGARETYLAMGMRSSHYVMYEQDLS